LLANPFWLTLKGVVAHVIFPTKIRGIPFETKLCDQDFFNALGKAVDLTGLPCATAIPFVRILIYLLESIQIIGHDSPRRTRQESKKLVTIHKSKGEGQRNVLVSGPIIPG
jgi:hypothetical protein